MLALIPLLFVSVYSIAVDGYCEHAPLTGRINDYPLKHLTVLIRHGDRSPVSAPCWPNSPNWECYMWHQERASAQPSNDRLYNKIFMAGRNQNPGNCSSGQLTVRGYDQQLKNGRTLRSVYGSFLPNQYDPTSVYVRSTDVPRTFLSAEGLLLGLFPATTPTCLNQTISINTMDNKLEVATPNEKQCPRLKSMKMRWQDSPEYKKFLHNEILPLETMLDNIFGRTDLGYDIEDMYDCVQAHACHDYPLPQSLTQPLYDALVNKTVQQYADMMYYTENSSKYTYVQIAMAAFIKEVTARIKLASQGQTSERMALFSAHDTTLLPFLMAYNSWGPPLGWPPYASMIQIELLDGGTGDLIRMYYNNKPVAIPGCFGTGPDYTCDAKAFFALSDDLIKADAQCDRSAKKIRRRYRRFGVKPENLQEDL